MAYNSFNKIFILGRLGRAPELRYSNSGNPVVRFPVATNERFKSANGQSEEHTEWHRIVVFGAAAENCAKMLKQGSFVFVEGKVRTRKYQDRDNNERFATEIIADMVHFLDSFSSGGEPGGGPRPPREEKNAPKGEKKAGPEAEFNNAISQAIKDVPEDDGDLPF